MTNWYYWGEVVLSLSTSHGVRVEERGQGIKILSLKERGMDAEQAKITDVHHMVL
jgi:hypothetical protein